MLQFKKLNAIALALIALFSVVLVSCGPRPGPGDGSSNTIRVDVNNPEWNVPIGYSSTVNPVYGPSIEVEITVNTLNNSNQATYFSTTIAKFERTVNGIPPPTLSVNGVRIPQSGAYVIEYRLKSLECTWPNTSGCVFNGTGIASKKRFKGQYTNANGGNIGSYFFNCTFADRYFDECC
jgi:hypothetical protein